MSNRKEFQELAERYGIGFDSHNGSIKLWDALEEHPTDHYSFFGVPSSDLLYRAESWGEAVTWVKGFAKGWGRCEAKLAVDGCI